MRLPVILIIVCYVLLILTDWLIISDFRRFSLYKKVAPSVKKTGRWWKVYTIFSILILSMLTVAICLPKRTAGVGIAPAMWLIYIVLSIEFAQIVYSLFSLFGCIPMIFRYKRWNTGLWIGLPMGILIFSMMWWGVLIGRNKIDITDINITSEKLPSGFNGYKIAQISDLHVGTWGNDTSFVARLVDTVNKLNPNLIVFTGDLVNRESTELLPFIKPLSRLKAKDGVLTILGNHDYGDYVEWRSQLDKQANLDSLKSYEKKMGWKMLDNESMPISNQKGDSIIVIGVGNWGEPPFSQYGNLALAYPEEAFNDDNFKILLSHNPEHWNREVSKISNIDLTLSGHTHAMQIMFSLGNLRWSPSKFKYDQWAGLYTKENDNGIPTKVYVNIGAGEVGIPMRIGAAPEITLFTLHSHQ